MYKDADFLKGFYIVYATFALILGIILGSSVDNENMLIIIGLFSIVSFIIMLVLKMKVAITLLCVIFSFGAISSFYSLKNIDINEGNTIVTGTIYGAVTEKEFNKQSFIIKDVSLDGAKVPYSAYCTYKIDEVSDFSLQNGDRISFEGNIYLPFKNLSDYSFDFRMYLKQNRLDFGISNIKNIVVLDKTSGNVAYTIREKLNGIFNTTLGEYAGLASALLLGDKYNLDYQEKQLYSKLGISHVFSVSGLHVGIIAGIVLLILKKLKVSKIPKAILLLAIVSIYGWITGFSPSTVRTILMLAILQASHIIGRKYELSLSLVLSCFVMLIINPLLLYSLSFIFSFCAVLGIALVSKRLNYFIYNKILKGIYNNKPLKLAVKYIISPLALSFGAQLGVFIPMVFYFGYISPISLILNIFIIPIIAILVPILMLVLFSYYIPILGTIIAFIAKLSCAITVKLISYSKVFENWLIEFSQPNVLQAISFIIIILLLLPGIFRIARKKRIILISITLAITLMFSYLNKPSSLAYTQLNVGQADCAVIRDGNYTIVIDTGETGIELSNYLKKYNRNIDDLFITHLHNDHAGGLESLIKNDVKINNIYISKWAEHTLSDEYSKGLIQLARDKGISITEVVAGDLFKYKDTNIKVMFPEDVPVRAGKDPNDSAMVLLININNCNILSMSDLTAKYENYAANSADILKVGHHGSKTSSSNKFLEYVSPSMAIITSSIKSTTIPHVDVINNLKNNNISMFRSDVHGDINIYFENEAFKVKTYTNKEPYEQR